MSDWAVPAVVLWLATQVLLPPLCHQVRSLPFQGLCGLQLLVFEMNEVQVLVTAMIVGALQEVPYVVCVKARMA